MRATVFLDGLNDKIKAGHSVKTGQAFSMEKIVSKTVFR
jgi:hypothetical protein